MGKETFLLLFVLGAAAIAAWMALRLPRLAPTSLRGGAAHLVVTLVVGAVLGPLVRSVPGLPSELSVLAALFLVALPAITYMLLVGMWLVQLAVAGAPARH
ncbi:MAG: hypothetical protein ACJ75Q_05290 [Gaiellaceae bacterium]